MIDEQKLIQSLGDAYQEISEKAKVAARNDPKVNEKNLQKDHPDISYSKQTKISGANEATKDIIATTSDGKKYSTDLGKEKSGTIGGNDPRGKSNYGGTWDKHHKHVKKQLDNMDDAISDVKAKKEPKDTGAKERMKTAVDKHIRRAGEKALSKLRPKKSSRGKGAKAERRAVNK